jgi:hypothetical protein
LGNQFPWGTLIAGISLIVIVGAGMSSIYAQNTQALRDLENIQLRMLPALQTGQDNLHQRIDQEVFRSRDVDTEMAARVAVMEGNVRRLIAFAESRGDAIEEMLLHINPELGAEYRRLRRRDGLIIEPPPIERRPGPQN